MHEPRDENDRIALALVHQSLADENAPAGFLAVVFHDRALEWRVPGRPTITLPDSDGERPSDLHDACRVTVGPVEGAGSGDQSSLGPADASTRDWEVSHFRGTCGSVRTERVRLVNGAWQVQGTRADKFF